MNLNKNLFSLFFILNCVVYSQEKNEKKDSIKLKYLDEVLVTATRTKRQLSSLPLQAQIITKEQIKASNSLRLSDVINEQTGLITVSDFGGGEGLQLQGMDSAYTLVMIDGVPLIGRTAGTLDLERITVANIKQIEIIKGASSCLYGSEAMGGVLNIITESATEEFHGSINQRSGSFNTHDTSVNLNYKENKLGINGSINRYSSAGYDLTDFSAVRTVDPFENYTIQAKINYKFNKKTTLLLSSRLFTQNQETSLENSQDELLSGKGKLNEWNSHLKLQHQISDNWDIYGELYSTQYQTKSKTGNLDGSVFSESYFDQLLVRPEARVHFNPNKKHSVIVGGGLTHESLDRTYFNNKPEFNAPYVYAQYDVNPTRKINIIVGARYDAHNKYTAQFSPKLAARYQLTNKLSAKASVGYGYKAPDFRQLYFNFTNPSVGYTVLGYNLVTSEIPVLESQGILSGLAVSLNEYNDNLKPESSINFNVGVDYKLNNQLKFSVNLFRNNIKNLIDTRVVANKTNGQNLFSYYNANEVYTQGVEFNTSYKPTKKLQISGGYQLLYAKDKVVEDKFENREVIANQFPDNPLTKAHYFGLPNRSRHMANFKVFYKNLIWKVNANIRGTYRSKYGLVDTNNTDGYIDNFDEFIEGYSIWNIAINKDFFKNHQIGFGVENIFDFKDVPSSSIDFIAINNIPGRTLYAKLNINF
ncbi:MAG: TonB-dependent receptor [Flavobacteriaceae bacterium]|nr:TonB-dependent receptor [Flavobacteriaceae bacterium]